MRNLRQQVSAAAKSAQHAENIWRSAVSGLCSASSACTPTVEDCEGLTLHKLEAVKAAIPKIPECEVHRAKILHYVGLYHMLAGRKRGGQTTPDFEKALENFQNEREVWQAEREHHNPDTPEWTRAIRELLVCVCDIAQLFHNRAVDETAVVVHPSSFRSARRLYGEAWDLFSLPQYKHKGSDVTKVWGRKQELDALADRMVAAPSAATPSAAVSAATEAMAKLAETVATVSSECFICHQQWGRLDANALVTRLKCDHTFCSDCIERWNQKHGSVGRPQCPTCKTAFNLRHCTHAPASAVKVREHSQRQSKKQSISQVAKRNVAQSRLSTASCAQGTNLEEQVKEITPRWKKIKRVEGLQQNKNHQEQQAANFSAITEAGAEGRAMVPREAVQSAFNPALPDATALEAAPNTRNVGTISGMTFAKKIQEIRKLLDLSTDLSIPSMMRQAYVMMGMEQHDENLPSLADRLHLALTV
jgi:hypothetical protein